MRSALGLSAITIYHSITLAAAIVALLFSVVSMIMPFSQLAISQYRVASAVYWT